MKGEEGLLKPYEELLSFRVKDGSNWESIAKETCDKNVFRDVFMIDLIATFGNFLDDYTPENATLKDIRNAVEEVVPMVKLLGTSDYFNDKAYDELCKYWIYGDLLKEVIKEGRTHMEKTYECTLGYTTKDEIAENYGTSDEIIKTCIECKNLTCSNGLMICKILLDKED